MRLVETVLSASFIGALLAAAALSPASAQSRDYVYADTFGNLIIESAAGYKRILVGRAEDAERAFGHMPDRGADPAPGASMAPPADCFRPAFLVKGRGYMYGFDQGVIPPLGAPCL
ncbi:hypothetical protein KEU06_04450 [Pseudaminobacter sp. 19-2017]|uniref:Uncharacterized protein n=1 Tax=Pseudaminobacter soli (ex Zhang et al. 2022) TaxID=2831468 RepID=A0A942DVY6_9HYPH|nr:hypothetical protein [Pseudaminobacter soli]MBS3647878.1 hypothetical protein [Pseudaminobacter soli]